MSGCPIKLLTPSLPYSPTLTYLIFFIYLLPYFFLFFFFFFFFNDPAPPEISPFSLHDALPILPGRKTDVKDAEWIADLVRHGLVAKSFVPPQPQRDLRELLRYRRKLVESQAAERNRLLKRSEEHTSELQSRQYLVCRLLLEKKK